MSQNKMELNPELRELFEILQETRTIAVVGYTTKPDRAGHYVPEYLRSQGYRIIPVNPALAGQPGLEAYSSLSDILPDVSIDLVEVFRRSEEVFPVVVEACKRGTKAVWLQLGIRSEEGRAYAGERGVKFVQDKCMAVVHKLWKAGR